MAISNTAENKGDVLKTANEVADKTVETVHAFQETAKETTKGVWHAIKGWVKERVRRFDDFQNLRRDTPW